MLSHYIKFGLASDYANKPNKIEIKLNQFIS